MRYINDIIGKGNVGGFQNANGKSVEKMLLEQAKYLQQLINKSLKDYRRNFTPIEYKRTGSLENSVAVSSNVRYVNGKLTAYVYFNENALHRSGFGVWAVKKGRGKFDNDLQDFDNPKSVNTALLINNGYNVTKPVWFADKPNFGIRKGNYFVEKAVEEFNKTNSMRIYIDKSDIINIREW